MNEFTFEEMNLMAIYNASGTREGLMEALTECSCTVRKQATENKR